MSQYVFEIDQADPRNINFFQELERSKERVPARVIFMEEYNQSYQAHGYYIGDCLEHKLLDMSLSDISEQPLPQGNFIVNSSQLAALVDKCEKVMVSVLNLGSLRLDKGQVITNLIGQDPDFPNTPMHESLEGIKVSILDGSVTINNPEWVA